MASIRGEWKDSARNLSGLSRETRTVERIPTVQGTAVKSVPIPSAKSYLSRDVLDLQSQGLMDCVVLHQKFATQAADGRTKADSDVGEHGRARNQAEAGKQLLERYPWRVLLMNKNSLNNLTGLHLCSRLRKLDLSHNAIVDMPNKIFWRSLATLEILHLHDNKIDSVHAFQDLSVLTRLSILSAYGNVVEFHPAYRHLLVNTCPALTLLDFFIVSDQELIEGATFSLSSPYRTYAPGLRCILPTYESLSEADQLLLVDYELRLVRKQRDRHSPVLRIQAWWRGVLVRRTLIVYHAAATCIQRAFRRFIAVRELERQEIALRNAQLADSQPAADDATASAAAAPAQQGRSSVSSPRTLFLAATSAEAVNIFMQLVRKVELQQQVVAGSLHDGGYVLLSTPDVRDDFPILRRDSFLRRRRNAPMGTLDASLQHQAPQLQDVTRSNTGLALSQRWAAAKLTAALSRKARGFHALRLGPRCTRAERVALAILRRRGATVPVAQQLRREVLHAVAEGEFSESLIQAAAIPDAARSAPHPPPPPAAKTLKPLHSTRAGPASGVTQVDGSSERAMAVDLAKRSSLAPGAATATLSSSSGALRRSSMRGSTAGLEDDGWSWEKDPNSIPIESSGTPDLSNGARGGGVGGRVGGGSGGSGVVDLQPALQHEETVSAAFVAHLRRFESLRSFRERLAHSATFRSRPRLLRFISPGVRFHEVLVRTLHRFNVELLEHSKHGLSKLEEQLDHSTKQILVYPDHTVHIMAAVVCIQSVWRSYKARKSIVPSIGRLILERRANACLVRWFKSNIFKARLNMLAGLKLYCDSIQDASLFMRGDAYQILKFAPNPFVRHRLFPEHSVVCDVGFRVGGVSDFEAASDIAAVQGLNVGLLRDRNTAEGAGGGGAATAMAAAAAAVLSQQRRVRKAVQSSQLTVFTHPSTGARKYPFPISLAMAWSGRCPPVERGPRDAGENDDGLESEEHEMWQGQNADVESARLGVPDESDDAEAWAAKQRLKQSVQAMREEALSIVESSGEQALTSEQRKLLRPWERSIRERLLNLLNVGVTVELVRDVVAGLAPGPGGLGLQADAGDSTLAASSDDAGATAGNTIANFFIRLTFPSVEEARLRAAAICVFTWDPRFKQNIFPLMTHTHVSRILAARTQLAQEQAQRALGAGASAVATTRAWDHARHSRASSSILRESVLGGSAGVGAGGGGSGSENFFAGGTATAAVLAATRGSMSSLVHEATYKIYRAPKEEAIRVGASTSTSSDPVVLRPWVTGTQERLTLYHTYWVEQEGRLTKPRLFPSDFLHLGPTRVKPTVAPGASALARTMGTTTDTAGTSSRELNVSLAKLTASRSSGRGVELGSAHVEMPSKLSPSLVIIEPPASSVSRADKQQQEGMQSSRTHLNLFGGNSAFRVNLRGLQALATPDTSLSIVDLKKQWATAQRVALSALHAERRLRTQQDILTTRNRSVDIVNSHKVKMEHIKLRDGVVKAVRLREILAEKQELRNRREVNMDELQTRAIYTKNESRKAAALAVLNRNVALRDVRRRLAREEETFEDTKRIADDERARQLAELKLKRRAQLHDKAKRASEKAASTHFFAQQNMIVRHLRHGMLQKEREQQQLATTVAVQKLKDSMGDLRTRAEDIVVAKAQGARRSAISLQLQIRSNLQLRQQQNQIRVDVLRAHRDHQKQIRAIALRNAKEVDVMPLPRGPRVLELPAIAAATGAASAAGIAGGRSVAFAAAGARGSSGVPLFVPPGGTVASQSGADSSPAMRTTTAAAHLDDEYMSAQIAALSSLADQVKDRFEFVALRRNRGTTATVPEGPGQ